jgi:diketogulonate reductase-like aldo/keto reductase
MDSNRVNRRGFLKETAAIAGAAIVASAGVLAQRLPKRAFDQVPLGKTGLKSSRLGIGTGTNSGELQRGLGHSGFNDLVRYAYDQGITFIDTADAYGTHTWVRDAIKGLPRERLYIQSKMAPMGVGAESAISTVERFRKELNTDNIDTVLIHCQIEGNSG